MPSEYQRSLLDHVLRAATPGTPEYAAQAIKDLFPSPNAFLASTQIPLLADAAGLAADAQMYQEQPETRSLLNFGLSGLGLLPFVPGVVGMMRKAPYDDALRAAQEHAALPKSQGGLGLPPDNTAADRARAMGFDVDTPLYHGTSYDFPEFSERRRSPVYLTDDPAIADIYSVAEGRFKAMRNPPNAGANTLPVTVRGNPARISDLRAGENGWYPDNLEDLYGVPYGPKQDQFKALKDKGYDYLVVENMTDLGSRNQTQYMIPDRSLIRSKFAAFDPFRRNEADLLAQYALPISLGALLGLPLLSAEGESR